MANAFDREQLLAAFDEIGCAAIAAGTRLDIAVFGGSAVMLASNFRFSAEYVDIAEIASRRSGCQEWLSGSPNAIDGRTPGLRASDPAKSITDFADIAALLRVLKIDQVENAIDVLAEFFPVSAQDAGKQRFVLRHLLASGIAPHAPEYPRRGD